MLYRDFSEEEKKLAEVENALGGTRVRAPTRIFLRFKCLRRATAYTTSPSSDDGLSKAELPA